MPQLICTNPDCRREKLSLGSTKKTCGKCGNPMVPKEHLGKPKDTPPRTAVTAGTLKTQYPDQIAAIEAAAYERGLADAAPAGEDYQDGFNEAVEMMAELAALNEKCLKKDGTPRADATDEELQRIEFLKTELTPAADNDGPADGDGDDGE